ncbi:hypothetical protein D3C77_448940 [compost metagenome]
MAEPGPGAVTEQGRQQVDGRAVQALDRQRGEHADEDDLRADDQVAGLGHRMYADHVEHGHQGDGGDDDAPHRQCREGDVEEQADQQVVDHRDEQVVEQQRPTGQKADVGAERQVGIGVGRARHREAFDHEAVGRRGEQHGQQGHQVGTSGAPSGNFGNDTVGGEYGQGNHVHQAEEYQGRKAEDAAQLGGICLGSIAGLIGHLSIRAFLYLFVDRFLSS